MLPQLLRAAFAPLRALDFVHGEVLDRALYALDHLTRIPVLQACLVHPASRCGVTGGDI